MATTVALIGTKKHEPNGKPDWARAEFHATLSGDQWHCTGPRNSAFLPTMESAVAKLRGWGAEHVGQITDEMIPTA